MSTAMDMLDRGKIPPSRLRYRLQIARMEAGLKQEELAALMGVGRTVVSNAEQGLREPRKIVLNAWALATGVPISWLEKGDGGWYPPEDGPDGCPHQGSNLGPADYRSVRPVSFIRHIDERAAAPSDCEGEPAAA